MSASAGYELAITAILTLAGLGFLLSLVLLAGTKIFKVKTDPRVDRVLDLLPGSNCGACGFGGCNECARAIIEEAAAPDVCPLCRGEAVDRISKIAGREVKDTSPAVAVVLCRSRASAPRNFLYRGIPECRAAAAAAGGETACRWGCLRYYDCVRSCPFDAFEIDSEGNPVVDPRRCRSCEICVRACPRGIIKMTPADKPVEVLCSSRDPAKTTARACPTGCIACGRCVKVCPRSAIEVKDNLARIDPELCDGCGRCVEVCPRKIIYLQGAREAAAAGGGDGQK